MTQKTSKRIFISHAAADAAIADSVVDLLNTGMQIDVEKDVFCTSLEALGIPAGEDFKSFIHGQIQNPEIVIMLISQNYLASQFCLAEAGAAWALSHRVIPILVPPTTYSDMKAVLAGLHALKIDSTSDWNELLAVFKEVLGTDPKINRWERKRDEELTIIKKLLGKQPAPPTVALARFEAIQKKLKEANEEIVELEQTNESLEKVASELKKAKDKKDVAKVFLKQLPVGSRFDKVTENASERLGQLGSEVRSAIYHHFRGSQFPMPQAGYSDFDDRWNAINREEEDGYLKKDPEGNIELNEEDPEVSAAIEALNELKSFIDDHPELAEPYLEENKHPLAFRSRRFWEAQLGL